MTVCLGSYFPERIGQAGIGETRVTTGDIAISNVTQQTSVSILSSCDPHASTSRGEACALDCMAAVEWSCVVTAVMTCAPEVAVSGWSTTDGASAGPGSSEDQSYHEVLGVGPNSAA